MPACGAVCTPTNCLFQDLSSRWVKTKNKKTCHKPGQVWVHLSPAFCIVLWPQADKDWVVINWRMVRGGHLCQRAKRTHFNTSGRVKECIERNNNAVWETGENSRFLRRGRKKGSFVHIHTQRYSQGVNALSKGKRHTKAPLTEVLEPAVLLISF